MPDIIEEWESVQLPSIPDLERLIVESETTALLVLDIQKQNCSEERRPRCVKSLPKIKILLEKARKKNMTVIHTLTRSASEKDIRKEVKPLENESVIKSGVDKFYQTDLENLLQSKNIKKLILMGTSSNGAVLHTATGAVQRKFDVIIPVDGISAEEIYAEQYTAWHLVNAPGTRGKVTLTRSDWIMVK